MLDIHARIALQERLGVLEAEHKALNQYIDDANQSVSVHQLDLFRIKRKKLKIKDEIERIRNLLMPDILA